VDTNGAPVFAPHYSATVLVAKMSVTQLGFSMKLTHLSAVKY